MFIALINIYIYIYRVQMCINFNGNNFKMYIKYMSMVNFLAIEFAL